MLKMQIEDRIMVANQIKKAVLEFNKQDNNVTKIFDMNLCNSCGACVLVCPKNAIEYGDGQLTINTNCVNCGKCLDICSQNQKERYQSDLIKRDNNDKIASYYSPFREIPIGDFVHLYNSRAVRKDILEHAMVGGTTLALLSLVLIEKIVDAVVITDFEKGKQFPISKIVKDEKTLLKSGGSRYLPTFSLKILEQIEEDESIQSVAITTLPCQAYAIRKLSMKTETKQLTEKIKFIFTLICGSGLPSRQDVEQFLKKKNIDQDLSKLDVYSEKVKKLWRLNPQAQRRYFYKDEEGNTLDFSSSKISGTKSFPNCSSVCPDYCGTQSDVSLGGSGIRSNFVISRTSAGEQLIQKAISRKQISVKKHFSFFNRLVINFMGKRKRFEQREIYEKLFLN